MEHCIVCALKQGWNKTLQGCGPLGAEFDTPALDSQLHVGASSLQFTSLIFYKVQVRGLG